MVIDRFTHSFSLFTQIWLDYRLQRPRHLLLEARLAWLPCDQLDCGAITLVTAPSKTRTTLQREVFASLTRFLLTLSRHGPGFTHWCGGGSVATPQVSLKFVFSLMFTMRRRDRGTKRWVEGNSATGPAAGSSLHTPQFLLLALLWMGGLG